MTDVVHLKVSKQAIRQQASEWLVKIDAGKLTEKEQQTLNKWVQQSPVHRQIITEMANNIDAIKTQAIKHANSSPKALALHKKPLTTRWRELCYKTAAAIAFALLIPLTYYLQETFDFQSTNGEYATQVGDQRSLELADGSTVLLNTDSRLSVEYMGSNRVIHLFQGEANFDVAPLRTKPFIVKAGNGEVQALGTSFAIRVDGDEINVLVSHGTVRISADADEEETSPSIKTPDLSAKTRTQEHLTSVVVSAGKSVTFSENSLSSVVEKDQESMYRQLYWRKGYLAFKSRPLIEVIEEVSRYTTFKIELKEAELADIRVGGYYPIDNLTTFFSSLEVNLGLVVEKRGNNHYLILKG